MRFSFDQVELTEFGIGQDDADGQRFYGMTVDGDVQDVLGEMATATWDTLQKLAATPTAYEPAEKHAPTEHVILSLTDNHVEVLRNLHEAQNLPLNNNALLDPTLAFCYFVRMTDAQGRKLTALRRAMQFKGILKNRLIRLVTDALKLIEDNVFKLDRDFDLLIDATAIHILRPSSFEFVCKLQKAVLAAVPQNLQAIEADLPTIDFSNVAEYASTHPRAARYLASIRTQPIDDVNIASLKKLCKTTGVKLSTHDGKITVDDGHVMGLLEVLDRRRYEIKLVNNSPETFRASSRTKIEQ